MKKEMKIAIIKLSIMVSLLFGYVIYDSYRFHFLNPNEEKGIHFNESNILGEITNCSANKRGTFFTVNDSIDLWVLPTRKSDGSFQMLCRDSKNGDRLEKKPFENILKLIKSNGDTIEYYFVKYLGNGEKVNTSTLEE